jgi:hypothetical protein
LSAKTHAEDSGRKASSPTPLISRAVVACATVVVLAGLVYLNALNNPFVYDDHRLIVENRSLLDSSDVRGLVLHDVTRPVVNISYAIDRAMWGPAPFGFHLTNVLLHMLNVALLFVLAWRVVSDRRRSAEQVGRIAPGVVAAGAALPFAIHPMLTEAVGYISGRSEVLCATLLLLAFLTARAWMQTDRVRYLLLTMALWLVALLTKETAGMFPFVLFAYDRMLAPGPPDVRPRRVLWLHLPLLLIATVAVAVRLIVFLFFEYRGSVNVDWHLLLVEVDVVVRYLRLMVLPSGQAIFHAVAPVTGVFDPRVLFAAAVIGGLLFTGWRLRRTEALVGFGVVTYLLFLLPSSMLVLFDRGEPMAEHRVYIASIGFFLAVGAAAGWLAPVLARRRPVLRWVLYGALALWILTFGARTVLRNATWSDPVVLWSEAANMAPGHWLPQLALGEALQNAGRCDEAVAWYAVSIEGHADEPATYRKLGLCLLELRLFDEARAAFEELRSRVPESNEAANGLGTVALMTGNLELARRYYGETLGRDSMNVAAHTALAVLEENVAGDAEAALRHCEAVAMIAPETPGNDECLSRNRARIAASGSG